MTARAGRARAKSISDITQAPVAWWLLASGDPKPLGEIAMPERARWVYPTPATTWPGVVAGH